jgi:membrane associated rhomboid family serine protease
MQVYLFVVSGLLAEIPADTAYWSHVAGFAFGASLIVVLRALTRVDPAPVPVREQLSIGD